MSNPHSDSYEDYYKPYWWDDGDIDDEDDDDIDHEPFEETFGMDECGFDLANGGCLLAGSEDCDFECPYRDMYEEMFESMHKSSPSS